MSEPNSGDVLRAASRLETSMGALREEITELHSQGQRSRHLIWALAVSLTLDVLLSVFLSIVAVQAHHASDRATMATSKANLNQQAQVTTCQASNQSRKVAAALWIYLLNAIDADPQESAKTKQQVKIFRQHVTDAYAQRDCSPKALAHSHAPSNN